MRIGVVSDTHDRVPAFRAAIERFREEGVDAVFHAGDFVAPFAAKLLTAEWLGEIPVYAIYGNNDGERPGLARLLPQLQDGPLRVALGGRTIAMHHYLDWFADADVAGADLVISGHDHTVSVEERSGRLYLNPGECCGWVMGRCTAALVSLETMEAEVFDLPTG